MNKEQMKSQLQRDKQFLKELYKSDSLTKSKRILTFASDAELFTLSKYLHFISNGEIHIKKENFNELGKRHISIIKQNFEKKASLSTFSQKDRKQKLQVLFKLASIFSSLLTPLFKE